jgi:hypothetical protein
MIFISLKKFLKIPPFTSPKEFILEVFFPEAFLKLLIVHQNIK